MENKDQMTKKLFPCDYYYYLFFIFLYKSYIQILNGPDFFFPPDHLQKNLCIYDFGETFLTHHADLVFKLVYTLQHF